MKRYVLTLIVCVVYVLKMNAQEVIAINGHFLPMQNVQKITSRWESPNLISTIAYKTDNGNDTIATMTTEVAGGFGFIGGKGNVRYYDYSRGVDTIVMEENQDVYVQCSNFSYYATSYRKSCGMTLMVSFGRNYNLNAYKTFGLCISKHPNIKISDNILIKNGAGSLYDYIDLYLYEFPDSVEYTIQYTKEESYSSLQTITIEGLDNMTTYYVRPYVILDDKYVMYGGEKAIYIPPTKSQTLQQIPEEVGRYYYHDAETGVVLTDHVLHQLAGDAINSDSIILAGVAQDLKAYMTDDMRMQLKTLSYKTIECVDGELYLVKDVPHEMIADFPQYFYSDSVAISPMQFVNQDKDITGMPLYTKNVGEINLIECDESWGVPYNSCVEFVPTSSSTNPYIAINIPKYLFPRTYSIYAVFVHPEDDPRGYRFYTYMWEKQTDDEGNFVYPSHGTRLVPPEGAGLSEGNYYMTDTLNRVDTLFIGNYTFNGAPESMIQFYTQVTSRQTTEYNRTMRIAQIYLVPTEEEEVEQ